MAYATNTAAISTPIRDRAALTLNALKARYAAYQVYRSTVNELESLSTRELNDLGISRSGIKAIAMEAAYNT
ncbi:DUF1127 domain-containing protein [Aestuariibius sp. HNIBRBA575]|uniref:DUF1127 domain-containing protein n=1 Tax=Aestuariibius sp. HNIBRBA575 TaxID=3233343 RepID=UPI0034A11AD2